MANKTAEQIQSEARTASARDDIALTSLSIGGVATVAATGAAIAGGAVTAAAAAPVIAGALVLTGGALAIDYAVTGAIDWLFGEREEDRIARARRRANVKSQDAIDRRALARQRGLRLLSDSNALGMLTPGKSSGSLL